MNYREKLVAQIVICMVIFAGIRTIGMLDIKGVREVKAFVGEHFQKNYTAEDIKTAGSRLIEEAGDIHSDITSVVLKANKVGEFGEPMGKADEDGIQVIYAAAAGEVTSVGINKDMGMYVKVNHNDKVTTYGNLCQLTVVTGDKVKKGQIIGSFDNKTEAEFLYSQTDL